MRFAYSLGLLCAAAGLGQTPGAAGISADVKSINGIVSAAYASISGPAGQPRDWTRLRSLFRDDARLIMVELMPDGSAKPTVMDWAAFQAGFTEFLGKDAFYEKEVSHQIQQFGHIAHVLSVYESRRSPTDPKPFMRGVNSFQL